MIDTQKFLRDGWIIVDIPYPGIIQEIILDMKEIVSQKTTCFLNQLHYHYNDKEIKKLHIEMSEYLWKKEYSLEIARVMLPILEKIIGLDVMVQYMPYLRIARPNKSQDNIGYHKDTQYGQTPYELAMHIPLVELDDTSAIRVISGTHIMPERDFRLSDDAELSVTKGSIENRTGRPYAPKRLLCPFEMATVPLAMRVGQIALFSPAIFHGQEVNQGTATRVSIDLRFVNSRAPIEIRKGKIHAGYIEVSKSPIEILATKYYEAQK